MLYLDLGVCVCGCAFVCMCEFVLLLLFVFVCPGVFGACVCVSVCLSVCVFADTCEPDRVRRPPGVIFVCTHIDEASDVDQARMIATHADILHQFSNQADFFPTLLFIDARNTRNTDFTTLREALDRFAKESIQVRGNHSLYL